MVHLTKSLQVWLFRNYPELLPLVMFGHIELITNDMYQKYLYWCKTPEGSGLLNDSLEN